MSGALDRDAELTLLTGVEAGLAAWFDLSVHIYEASERLCVFVVKVCWDIFFESSCHMVFLLSVEIGSWLVEYSY